MLLEIAGWMFDINLEATMAYSSKESQEHCDCAYCRNFYATVDTEYPGFRPFLARFGLNVEGPDELMPFDDGIYEAVYAVNGSILKQGSPIKISDVPVDIGPDDHINTGCPEPYFTIGIGLFRLPWVLEEPAGEVVSAANTPFFLKKMWKKLLKKAEDTPEQ